MTKHYNPSIAEDSSRILNSKSSDVLGSDVGPLTPVIPITRVCNIVRRAETINQATATLYNTPADKDFYLTAANLSTIKDAGSTSLSSYIAITVNGSSQFICYLSSFSGTASSKDTSMSFVPPIKIDRNTSILIVNNAAVANIATYGSITGYTVETTKEAR